MPGHARRELVREGEVGVFHCVQRCVRRAFLCGQDPVSGRSFGHRRAWVEKRLEELAAAFAVEVLGYAVMANHLHVMVRVRPDLAAAWSPRALAERWWRLHPARREADGAPAAARLADIEAILAARAGGDERVHELRSRLASLSWFMGHLAEPIARRANEEDRCTGRFWEGRFKSQALLDEAAVLACALYVGLNPIRAGLAATPETSSFTGDKKRIDARQASAALQLLEGRSEEATGSALAKKVFDPSLPDPLPDRGVGTDRGIGQGRGSASAEAGEGAAPREVGLSAPLAQLREQVRADAWLCPIGASSGYLPALDLDRYLVLLDWTGRQAVTGKPGVIPPDLPPILDRLRIDAHRLVEVVLQFGARFRRVAGSVASITAEARRAGRRWLHGIEAARWAFGPA